jgi:hypothetical protein
MKILKITAILLIFAGIIACGDKEDYNSLLDTKWKLVGIVDAETGDLTELEPKDCDDCYTLAFDADDYLSGKSSTNFLACTYRINYKAGKFYFANIGGTEMGEFGDGYKYVEILWEIKSFIIKDTYLYLYYNDNKNYLKYKEIGD